jgi:SAM-dependent methyltransferase
MLTEIVDLEFFLRSIRDNRFFPTPSPDRIFTGDLNDLTGFRQNGIDALRSLVQLASVGPNSRVLEIGSGIGRVALPLTQWLSTGSYVGVEVVMEGVAWCHEFIARTYSNFQFIHLDIHNEFYNPTGRGSVADVGRPFDDAAFDIVFLNSVFTHPALEDTVAYLSEIARVLAADGRLWGSWFLVDKEIGAAVLDMSDSRVPLGWTDGNGVYYSNDRKSTNAVAYDEELAYSLLTDAGFQIRSSSKGDWLSDRPRIDGGLQDLIICGRPNEILLPTDFNPDRYLELNPDVAEAGADPATHWKAFGYREGRQWK